MYQTKILSKYNSKKPNKALMMKTIGNVGVNCFLAKMSA